VDGVADARRDALDPGLHGARTHWIRGFMTFQLVRRIRTVMLMVTAIMFPSHLIT